MSSAPAPTEIRLRRAEKVLEIEFGNGERVAFPAEYLRVESPSAEVQGHGPGQRRLVAGRRNIGIVAIEPVGNYAIRVVFDDRHDSGIFSWEYLAQLAREQDRRWQEYLAGLAAKGLSRDP